MLVLAIGDLHIPDRAIDVPAKFKKLLVAGKISQVLCLGNLTDKQTLDWLGSISPDLQLIRGDQDSQPASLIYNSLPRSLDLEVPGGTNASKIYAALPLFKTVHHGELKIGITASHNTLSLHDPDTQLIIARQLDVDILICGGAHRVEAFELDGKFFVSPGSATGAFSVEKYTDDGLDEDEEEINGTEDKEDKKEDKEAKKEDKNGSKETTEGETKDEAEKNGEEAKITEPAEAIPSFCLLDIQGSVCVLYVYMYIDGDVKVDKISYRKLQ
ncbi:Vacuolar protein sorting-associated protein 29 [Yarrowia sp. C11]|nr:Vacuolar protein sorting-associated protein 29 [Yarrowia sp. C11]KAG5370597.1 Vacuolar protein sorting-associated protein 29 [Yarrowia sp. E02]